MTQLVRLEKQARVLPELNVSVASKRVGAQNRHDLHRETTPSVAHRIKVNRKYFDTVNEMVSGRLFINMVTNFMTAWKSQ